MSEELDDIGAETAAMMRTMLQIATLVALKTRERGQREAEARAKASEARLKEARELQIREAREAKARDPRNLELAQTISRAAAEIQPPTVTSSQRNGGYRGVHLEKQRVTLEHGSVGAAGGGAGEGIGAAVNAVAGAAETAVQYDSAERRAALAAHLARIGIAPELAAARMLVEVGQAKPPIEAVRTRPEQAPSVIRAREQELIRARTRGLDRER